MVSVIDLDGGGADVVVDEEEERDGSGVRVPIRLIVSPTRMSVYAQSSRRLAVKRSSSQSILAVKVYPVLRLVIVRVREDTD